MPDQRQRWQRFLPLQPQQPESATRMALERIARRLRDAGLRRDAGSCDLPSYVHGARLLVGLAGRLDLTVDDIDRLAAGTHVSVPVQPTKAMVNAMAAAIWQTWLASPLGAASSTVEPDASWDELCLLATQSEKLALYRDTALAEARAAHRAMLAARTAAPAADGTVGDIPAPARWRHRKRGSTYTEIGRAALQASSDAPVEGSTLVVYRGDDGRLWCREEGEFEDGRFERIDGGDDAAE